MIAALVGLGSAVASAENEGNVEICHRTNSNANPYVTPPPNQSGQNGGTDHFNEHKGPLWTPELKKQKIEWGDIIPPSAEHPEGSQAYQELAATQAWQDFVAGGGTFADFIAGEDGDDCTLPDTPEVPTHDVTLAKVTDGDDAPDADADFTFTVVCESGTVPASPVTVSPEDGAVTVASGVAEGDSCTIAETDDGGADNTTFAVAGGTPVDADSAVATVDDADVAVVATNTFEADVQGKVIEKPKTPEAPVVEPAQLPRTGTMTPYYVAAAAALLLAGAVARTASRRITARIEG
jgi:hypothetical protein